MAQNVQRLLDVAGRFVQLVQTRPELQRIPGFSEAQMILIGGLAVTSYTLHRTTKEIDIAVSPPSVAIAMKEVLKRLRGIFEPQMPALYLLLGNDESVRIDIVPVGELPYHPSRMETIVAVNPAAIPIADPLDLITFKAFFCQFRSTPAKGEEDARDIYRLMIRYQSNDHLALMMHTQVTILREAAPLLRQYGPRIPWGGKLP